jgi:hypothetical protein
MNVQMRGYTPNIRNSSTRSHSSEEEKLEIAANICKCVNGP